jgi:hypothetical protein
MSIDDRIRTGLSRNSMVPAPPVEQLLDRVRRTHRRRSGIRLLGVAAAVVLVGLASLALVHALVARRVEPTRPGGPDLPGTYQVVVPQDAAVARMRGTWRVSLTADGRVALTAPPTFRAAFGTGATYDVSGSTLTSNVFIDVPGCQRTSPAVGTYRFVVTEIGLELTRLDDSCRVRTVLFGASWERLP